MKKFLDLTNERDKKLRNPKGEVFINQVILIGNSGGDVELKETQNGTPVIQLSVATSKKYKEEWVSTWHRVVYFGKGAPIVAQQVKKGSKVFVAGELQTRQWQDKNGNKRETTEVLARNIYVIEKPQKDQGGGEFSSSNEFGHSDDLPF